MPRAVKFSRYGGTEVLEVVEVEKPVPGPGQALVRVAAAATNPGEIGIRQGMFANIWPAHFPEGQGNDFAGTVEAVGSGVHQFRPGDAVVGFAPRAAQADYVALAADRLTAKPAALPWEQAATIPAAGATAYAAVQAVDPRPGETVVVSAAAGGVGSFAAQLARLRGADVIGTASEHNFDYLRSLGVTPVAYGPGLAERIRAHAPGGVDAYLDNFGDGNVQIALSLGVSRERVNTIVDGRTAALHGVRSDAQQQADLPAIWAALADHVVQGRIRIEVQSVYPLERVRDAYEELARRHTRGKIVLRLAD
jgi:NADPH:quinone reductase-like Zn-dependent oxidoreductase